MSTLKNRILNKIKNGEIKMKPRWIFVAKDRAICGLWIALIMFITVTFVAMWKFIDIYKPLELFFFGEVGRELIREDFPYLWLFLWLISTCLAIWIFKKIGNNYRKNTFLVLTIIWIITTMLAVLFKIVI